MKKPAFKEGWQWPAGIILGYLIFVSGTLYFVFMSFNTDWDLVTENYYEKTLVYQQKLDAENNALSLQNPLRWELTSGAVTLFYPVELLDAGMTGEITMYRPSDARLDFTLPVQFDERGVQIIALEQLRRGAWTMEVSWTSGDVAYYTAGNLYLQ